MNATRIVLLILSIGISLGAGTVPGKMRPIAAGDNFPNVGFRDILSKGDMDYLGIGKKKKETFSIKDLRGMLFIFEIFSTYCMSCPKNVPVLNTVYVTVNSDPELREKVKVLAVAVGNTENEAWSYKREYNTLYPVLTDFTFAFHKALGNPRVPYTIIVKRDARGRNIVLYIHLGVIQSVDNLLKEVRKLLRQDPALK